MCVCMCVCVCVRVRVRVRVRTLLLFFGSKGCGKTKWGEQREKGKDEMGNINTNSLRRTIFFFKKKGRDAIQERNFSSWM